MEINNNNFVKIKTQFRDNDRNVKSLKEIYNQKEKLLEDITQIIGKETIDFNNKRILLKPNWVIHPRKEHDYYSLYTHPNIVLACLEFILMNFKPLTITIGDAPLQDCIWSQLMTNDFYEEINSLSHKNNVPIQIKDFRRVAYNFEKNELTEEINPLTNYTIIDLGSKSALEPITKERKSNFRVTNYDPRRMKDAHRKGIHKYCVINDIFENDIILTLPKLKTHQKSGITGALKILVGINGDKDFLPHHRKGGQDIGGDCYPGKNKLRYLTESFFDFINRYRGTFFYKVSRVSLSKFWDLFLESPQHNIGAAWYGNDTVWRMVNDLNTIVHYSTKDGLIADTQQRSIYSLGDGIVGGEGDGPLNPDPLALGVLTFSNNSLLNDYVLAKLMKFDPCKVPLIRDIPDKSLKLANIFINEEKVSLSDIDKISLATNPAPGWKGHIEK